MGVRPSPSHTCGLGGLPLPRATRSSPGLGFLIWAGGSQLGAGPGQVCGLLLPARHPEPPSPGRGCCSAHRGGWLQAHIDAGLQSVPLLRGLVATPQLSTQQGQAGPHRPGGIGAQVGTGQMQTDLSTWAPSPRGPLWWQPRDPAPSCGLCCFPGQGCVPVPGSSENTHGCWMAQGAEPVLSTPTLRSAPASQPGPLLADQGGAAQSSGARAMWPAGPLRD